MNARSFISLAASLATFASIVTAARAQCGAWSPGFGIATFAGDGSVVPTINSATQFDDGSGNALYIAGSFTRIGEQSIANVAKWDGRRWLDISAGITGDPSSFCVYDDGRGKKLYASDVAGVHRWDGTKWNSVGGPMSPLNFMVVHDDGSGAKLVVASDVVGSGGFSWSFAAWDGSSWSSFGDGFDGLSVDVFSALESFDDGTGAQLYAAGHFLDLAHARFENLERWDGAHWTSVRGISKDGFVAYLSSLKAIDIGGRKSLFVGGDFDSVDGLPTHFVVERSGSKWIPLSDGLKSEPGRFGVFDDGSGESLVTIDQGAFYFGGNIRAWNGTNWRSIGTCRGSVPFTVGGADFAQYDDAHGPGLVAFGGFKAINGCAVDDVAWYHDGCWRPLERGNGISAPVRALTVLDDGAEQVLCAGGDFSGAGRSTSRRVSGLATWNGSNWNSVASEANFYATSVQSVCSGSGIENAPTLFVGGLLNVAGSNVAACVGDTWLPVGRGVLGATTKVCALCEFDDGSGPALYVGGSFAKAGSANVQGVARWNGIGWQAVGAGVASETHALASFDDGTGAKLVAAGINSAFGNRIDIESWNGAQWTLLAPITFGKIYALCVAHTASGRDLLYVGGDFTSIGGLKAKYIAMWDGRTWSKLDKGVDGPVDALASVMVNGRPVVVAGGEFTHAALQPAAHIAAWDGSSWSAMDAGTDGFVYALDEFDDGTGPALYVGGSFQHAGLLPSSNIAKWRFCGE